MATTFDLEAIRVRLAALPELAQLEALTWAAKWWAVDRQRTLLEDELGLVRQELADFKAEYEVLAAQHEAVLDKVRGLDRRLRTMGINGAKPLPIPQAALELSLEKKFRIQSCAVQAKEGSREKLEDLFVSAVGALSQQEQLCQWLIAERGGTGY